MSPNDKSCDGNRYAIDAKGIFNAMKAARNKKRYSLYFAYFFIEPDVETDPAGIVPGI